MRVINKSSRLLLLCLYLMLTLAVPAWGEAQTDDPVVVRVGQICYPLSIVQSSLDSSLDVASLLADAPVTDEDRQAGIDAVVDKFVNMGLIENKLAEAGKNDFSEAEMVRRHRRERHAGRQRRGDADRARQGAHQRQQQPAAVRRRCPGRAGTVVGIAQALSERRQIRTRRKSRPSPAAAAAD